MVDDPVALIEVELVYALAHEQVAETLQVAQGTSVGQAIEQSGIFARHPEIATRVLRIGVFGRRVAPTALLHEFDRIEIYRPLAADPKQARRTRARRTGKSKS